MVLVEFEHVFQLELEHLQSSLERPQEIEQLKEIESLAMTGIIQWGGREEA